MVLSILILYLSVLDHHYKLGAIADETAILSFVAKYQLLQLIDGPWLWRGQVEDSGAAALGFMVCRKIKLEEPRHSVCCCSGSGLQSFINIWLSAESDLSESSFVQILYIVDAIDATTYSIYSPTILQQDCK